jgi:murein L,D-transpeptidase YafK
MTVVAGYRRAAVVALRKPPLGDIDYPVMARGFKSISGSFTLIRARVARALALSAVLAGALTLAGCYGEEGYQIPTRAMKELSPEMLTLLQQKNMPKDSPILVRIFKEESELEVWKQDTSARYELLKVYPICRWSGDIGPKVKEGDRQAPEGFYPITPGLMNPNSSYYLAINTGFPNAFDKANNYSGAVLMIHGDCSSRGCYAMTDEQIGEIYSLARESFLGGQKAFQVQAYPFRMTPANLARHRNNPNMAFWKMIKVGSDHFEVSHLEPKVDVCDKHYVFDAVAPGGSNKPLNFSPRGPCPAYDVDPQFAEAAMAKQQNDDYQLAQLTKDNVATAPLDPGTDGGMNRVFMSKLDNPTYTYDNEGHLHVPPLQPGRLPPQISVSATPTVTANGTPADSGSSVGHFFSGLFTKDGGSSGLSQVASASPETTSAPAPAPTHTGFFGSLFSSNHDTAPPPADTETTTASTPPPAKPKPTTGLRPRINPETQVAKTLGSGATASAAGTPAPAQSSPPQKDANAAAPPPSNNGGVMNGATPVMPTGTFNNRWGGFQ